LEVVSWTQDFSNQHGTSGFSNKNQGGSSNKCWKRCGVTEGNQQVWVHLLVRLSVEVHDRMNMEKSWVGDITVKKNCQPTRLTDL